MPTQSLPSRVPPSSICPDKIKTIFFDVGNTLLFPNRERIHAPLIERGIPCDGAQVRDLERHVKNEFDSVMTKDGNRDQSFWVLFYTRLFAEIGVKDDALRNQLVSNTRESANWDQILPDTREHLLRLGERYRLGVISNADGKIEDVLRRCGIADCFHTITDSGLVGYEKPHPEIFRQALGSLNAQPEESLYVGDVYFVDYLGATGAGMQAVLMDVIGAYLEKGVPRIESLAELDSMLASTNRST
jgi:HAD superfamily hydrolase (TIGR01549 family)